MAKWNILVEEPKGEGNFVDYKQGNKSIKYDDSAEDAQPVGDYLIDLQNKDPDNRCFAATYIGG